MKCIACHYFDLTVNYAPIGQCASHVNYCGKLHCHRKADDNVCPDFEQHPRRIGWGQDDSKK